MLKKRREEERKRRRRRKRRREKRSLESKLMTYLRRREEGYLIGRRPLMCGCVTISLPTTYDDLYPNWKEGRKESNSENEN